MPEKDKTDILDVPDMLIIEMLHVNYATYSVAFALRLLVWVGIHFDCGGLLILSECAVLFLFFVAEKEDRW